MKCVFSWIRIGRSVLAIAVILSCFTSLLAGESEDLARKITDEPAFLQRIIYAGDKAPPVEETRALWAALSVMKDQGARVGLRSLEDFVSNFPDSGWTPSLRSNLGQFYRRHGRFSLALAHWQAAWQASKDYKDSNGKAVADMTLGFWVPLLSSLGRTEQLAAVFAETKDRSLGGGTADALFNRTREAYLTMLQKPGKSYACGTYALFNVLNTLQPTNSLFESIMKTPSPKTGFSIASLEDLANQFEPSLIAVQRLQGEELMVPSIIHWKVDHYAALLQRSGDYFLVKDPTFRLSKWLSAENINAEASGYFMVEASKINSKNWRQLSAEEQAVIFGKGLTQNTDDEDDQDCTAGENGNLDHDPDSPQEEAPVLCPRAKDCIPGSNAGGAGSPCGMPVWWVAEPYINLWIKDTPLFYTQSDGSILPFSLMYKQRDTKTNAFAGGVGAGWECNWLSYLQIDTTNSINDPYLYTPGGGQRNYKSDGAGGFLADYISRSVVASSVDGSGNISYSTSFPTRSLNTYGYKFKFSSGATNYYLSKMQDAYGRTRQFQYETTPGNVVRLTNIVDYDGKTSSLQYTNTTFPQLITAVQDPYGRVARLFYDSNGRLTNITDVGGLTSRFAYNVQNLITNMTTPYGVTSFTAVTNSYDGYDMGGTNVVNRSLLISEPEGAKQLYFYRDLSSELNDTNSTPLFDVSFDPDAEPDTTPYSNVFEFGEKYSRNTFHWGRKQYSALSASFRSSQNFRDLTLGDYSLAQVRHWLHKTHDGSLVDQTYPSWEQRVA